MNSSFEVIVKFGEQKFEICINEEKQTISFRDIYPKLQEVIKISANEDIDLLTHDFELFCPGETTSYTLRDLNVQVKNLTLISIKSPALLGEIPVLQNYRQEVEDFHSIVMVINIGWDFCGDVSMANWERVTNILNRTDRRHRPRLCKYLFYKWIDFYDQNYDKLENRIGRSSQNILDLLKVVHVLDLDKFDISPYTQRHIEGISKSAHSKKYYWQHLAKIREKKEQNKEEDSDIQIIAVKRGPTKPGWNFSRFVKGCPQAVPIARSNLKRPNIRTADQRGCPPIHKKINYKVASTFASKKPGQSNARPEHRAKVRPMVDAPILRTLRHEVEDFHAIVMAINIGWDFSGHQSYGNWEKVSDIIRQTRFAYRSYRSGLCRELFYRWINFYVQKYDTFDGNIAYELQKTFDLLKVVHVLDLDKFNINSDTRQKISAISQSVMANPKYYQHQINLLKKKVQELKAVTEKPRTYFEMFQDLMSHQKAVPTWESSWKGPLRHNQYGVYRGNGTHSRGGGSSHVSTLRDYNSNKR